MLNVEKLYELMRSRGWSEVRLARRLKMDYSYVYRTLRGQRNCGRKMITAIMNLCKEEGLDYELYLDFKYEDKIKEQSSKNEDNHV